MPSGVMRDACSDTNTLSLCARGTASENNLPSAGAGPAGASRTMTTPIQHGPRIRACRKPLLELRKEEVRCSAHDPEHPQEINQVYPPFATFALADERLCDAQLGSHLHL